MKKQVLLFVLCAVFSLGATAQTSSMSSKNGHEILPQAGDYSLSMDAVPVVNFALNAMNIMSDNGQGAQAPGYVTGFDQVIVGKQFISATEAYRVRVGLGFGSNASTTYYNDANGDEQSVSNNASTMNIILAAGKEMRRGHNRLQGYYGYEALLGLSSASTSSEWSESITDAADQSPRTLSTSTGMGFGLGARAFTGVEYFFAPKMSIGAEFGWGVGFSVQGRGSTEVEAINADGNAETTETDGAESSGGFGFGVDNANAALMINFHF